MRVRVRRAARAFTLLEVMISLFIAATGVVYLYQGVDASIRVEARRRFYDRCANHLLQNLEAEIREAMSKSDGRAHGQFQDDGAPVEYTVLATQVAESDFKTGALFKIDVTFVGQDQVGFPRLTFSTWFTPLLRARRAESAGSP